MIKLSVAIMAVPSRSDEVNRIVKKLGVRVPVFYDTDKKGPWFNAQRAWGSVRSGASHHLVLQDDIVLCGNFMNTVEHLCSLRPNDILNLFSMRKDSFEAQAAGTSWIRTDYGVWGQAIVMPVPFIPKMLRWSRTNLKEEFPYDDSRITMWMESIKRSAYVPSPNIVDHIDGESTLGHKTPLPRKSRYFIGEDVDGMSVDWNKGFDTPRALHLGNSTTKYAKHFINAPQKS